MAEAYTRKLILLEKIVRDGIQKLLAEAKEKGHEEYPYGRLPNPTPLITEEEFLAAGGIECDDDEPEFKFDYGFDPLKYLADYIMWAHPDTVEERKQQKLNAAQYLNYRANYAKHQLTVARELVYMAQDQASGILWGPFSTPLSCSSVLCISKPLKLGSVVFQLCESANFAEGVKTMEVKVALTSDASLDKSYHSDANLEDILSLSAIVPVKATFEDLKSGTKYFVRCCLKDPPSIAQVEDGDTDSDTEGHEGISHSFLGPEANCFKRSEFWTLPSEDPASASSSSGAAGDLGPGSALAAPAPRAQMSRRASKAVKQHQPLVPPVDFKQPSTREPVTVHCFGQLPLDALSSFSSSFRSKSERGYCSTAAEAAVGTAVGTAAATGRHPALACLLGDLLTHSYNGNGAASKGYVDQLTSLFLHCSLFSNPASPLRRSSFLLGGRDGSGGSSNALRLEEIAHKQFRHDFKKYQKKYGQPQGSSSGGGHRHSKHGTAGGAGAHVHIPPPPVLKRPVLRDSLHALLQSLPLDLEHLPSMVAEREAADREREAAAAAAKAQGTAGTSPRPGGAASARYGTVAALSPRGGKGGQKGAGASIDHINACRMMYRSVMVGPDVEVVVLDMRGGEDRGGDYLGKEQAAWLQHTLQNSTAQWKLVLCGRAAGVVCLHPDHEVAARGSNATEADLGAGGEGKGEGTGQQTGVAVEGGEAAAAGGGGPKQVQLMEPDKAHAAAADEQLDELYGRSLCSLQHVLAQLQEKLHVPRSPYQQKLDECRAPPPIDPASSPIHVSSGIVLLSSGLARSATELVVSAADAQQHHHHLHNSHEQLLPQDELCPAFVAAYSSLLAPPLGAEDPDTDIQAQRLPTCDELQPDPFLDVFCAEVSLGQLSRDRGLLVAQGQGLGERKAEAGDDGHGQVRVQSHGPAASSPRRVFCYREGVAARTVFSAATGKEELQGQQEQQVSGQSGLQSSAYCEVQLLPSGDLRLQLFDALSAVAGTEWGDARRPLLQCLFAAPTLLNASDKDSDAHA